MRFLLVFLLSILLVACARGARQGGDVLVIGDSVMAWNRDAGADVGSVLASELNRTVVSRAVVGALVTENSAASLFGLSIPDQLGSGQWNWVVVNGGANDLGLLCRCSSCEPVIESLISAEGQFGAIPSLVGRARAQGARVLWLGYYAAPETPAFRGCRPALVEVERRIEVLAASDPDLLFLDAEDIFDPPTRDLFDPDRTHPSPRGSRLIGEGLAAVIAAESGSSP